jgi:hypothetical protein
MLLEEPDDGVVAANPVRELEDVVPLVVEDEVVDVASERPRCSTTSRDSRSTTRGSFWPWMTRSGHETSSICVFGDRSTRKSLSFSGIADREGEVRLPRLRETIHEREQVVRPEHVDRRSPELRVPGSEA